METPHTHTKVSRERGQVMLVITLFMLAGSLIVVGGIASLVTSQVRVMKELSFSKATFALADGALEEVVYRHVQGMDVSTTETLSESGMTVTTESTATLDGFDITASGDMANRVRKVHALLLVGSGASFSFGVQTSNGGFILENSSSVNGNVYSNGAIVGSGLNNIIGTAVSAGPTGRIEDIHTTEHMYANRIDDAYAEGDAYYQTIDAGTIVDGIKYPGSPNLATSSLPIPDSMLDAWEAYAATTSVMTAACTAAGGTLVIDYDVTLGPVKIPCNVKFEKFPNITVAGVIWITGDVSFKQGPKFTIAPAIGNKTVPIVVDKPTNRLTSSRVTMENSGVWTGNGNRSYILVVSRNQSAEQGGGETAIRIKNSTGGSLLVYSNHGEVALENNTDLTMITAWRVRLQNSTEVNYDTGIASTLFETGPGGGYTIDSWTEVE